jgi:hypothetical protein
VRGRVTHLVPDICPSSWPTFYVISLSIDLSRFGCQRRRY